MNAAFHAADESGGTEKIVRIVRNDSSSLEAGDVDYKPGTAVDLERTVSHETSADDQPRTVLVVDDEPTVRFLIVQVLDDLNYKSLEAVDGPSALKIVRSDEPIDLMITDVGLPGGMDGRDLAVMARTVRAGFPILFITGYDETRRIRGWGPRTRNNGAHQTVLYRRSHIQHQRDTVLISPGDRPSE